MKIILASSERFSGCIIEALRTAGHQVEGVVSPARGIYERNMSRSRTWINEMRGWNVLSVCRKHKIDFRVSRHLEDGSISAFLRAAKADLLLLFGWPTLVQPKTLDLFTYGGMNIHPSRLPLLRGGDPIFDAVDLDLDALGVSFHKVVEELDAGNIYHQEDIGFSRLATYDELYQRILDAIPIG